MSTEHQGGSSSNKVLWIVLGIAGGVILLCGGLVVVCLLAITMLGKSVQTTFEQVGMKIEAQAVAEAEAVAEDFLEKIGAGQVDAAYSLTTKGFQSRQSLAQLRTFVDRHPILKKHESCSTDGLSTAPNAVTVQATVEAANGDTVSGTLQMVQENGQWKVDKFTIP